MKLGTILRLLLGDEPSQSGRTTQSASANSTSTAQKPRVIARPVRRAQPKPGRIAVQPRAIPYWQTRGWRRDGRVLKGAYRTARQSVAGEIQLDASNRPSFFIIDPPAGVLSGPHGACFRARGDGRFWVHFNCGEDIDAGILAIEGIVATALGLR